MGFLDKLITGWEHVKKAGGALREIDELAKQLAPTDDEEKGPDDTEEPAEDSEQGEE